MQKLLLIVLVQVLLMHNAEKLGYIITKVEKNKIKFSKEYDHHSKKKLSELIEDLMKQ